MSCSGKGRLVLGAGNEKSPRAEERNPTQQGPLKTHAGAGPEAQKGLSAEITRLQAPKQALECWKYSGSSVKQLSDQGCRALRRGCVSAFGRRGVQGAAEKVSLDFARNG